MKKIIYWTPRILGIIFIIFLMMFSLDVFEMGLVGWQIIIGLFMHNLTAFFLLIILIISWKYEIVGGTVFIISGLFYLIFSSLIIALPALLIGILFMINWKAKKIKGELLVLI